MERFHNVTPYCYGISNEKVYQCVTRVLNVYECIVIIMYRFKYSSKWNGYIILPHTAMVLSLFTHILLLLTNCAYICVNVYINKYNEKCVNYILLNNGFMIPS